MKLSVVIPAYNEAESIPETLRSLYNTLNSHEIDHEIWVTNDNSKDNTLQVLEGLKSEIPTLVFETNKGPNGFGYAVRYGLERFSGDCVAVFMADMSDDPEDLVQYYRTMQEKKVDAVFGNRWGKGGKVIDYPQHKKVINRLANFIVKTMMRIDYNDTTNAFKLYKRTTIEGVKPFLSPHFNLTIELPLKAIVRGYTYAVVPNSWTNRKYGESKLKIKEMGSRYFFILMYCFIEKYFSRGDYMKKD
ncbi:glycosyltransferase family 2 protein [Marinilongibacter aquaticus]|uniref:glycosyltransferase family 2 protein n=1 Tax=Marinilongibacter aquaticus TaxID=2975157 RepID=UPI0021BDDD3A|nr:glycosyltransferase family 2 protein [Marinilongibacter aquaticus]UBM60417.1 glycosyltransferase family 2 protein [Marinilongibacter aquaticus]